MPLDPKKHEMPTQAPEVRAKNFDEVAYIRFASVYRKFADISMFKEELEELLRSRADKS